MLWPKLQNQYFFLFCRATSLYIITTMMQIQNTATEKAQFMTIMTIQIWISEFKTYAKMTRYSGTDNSESIFFHLSESAKMMHMGLNFHLLLLCIFCFNLSRENFRSNISHWKLSIKYFAISQKSTANSRQEEKFSGFK